MPSFGLFPYINADATKIEVDGKVYVLDTNTVLRNELGAIEYDGVSAIKAANILVKDVTKVFDIEVKDTNIITSFKYQRTAAQIATGDVAAAKAKVNTTNAYEVPFGTTDVDAAVKALIEADVDTDKVTVAVSGTTVTITSKNDTSKTATETIQTPVVLGAISGKISDSSANPIAGAAVKFVQGTNEYTATTAADGTYTIVDVTVANGYTGTVKADGYLDGSIASFNVTAGTKETKDVTLNKDITAPVIGSVTGTTATPTLTVSITEANTLKAQVDKGAFTVTVNGVNVAVTNATIDASAKTVTLTLETNVVTGNNVTVKYAATGTNDIEDASGNKAITTIVSATI